MVFDADLVILGGGCAGLSLAAALAERLTSQRVIVVEPRTDYTDDRSWCFWRPHGHELTGLVSASWQNWRFSADQGSSITHSVPGLTYQYIRSADFYARSLRLIEDAPTIELHSGVTVTDLGPVRGGIRVATDRGALLTTAVVDTRPVQADALLYQCFSGVEIRTTGSSPFDPAEVGLMTSMSTRDGGLGFLYLLPLDRDRALVEWTRFSDTRLAATVVENQRDAQLARLGLADAHVLRTEGGVLGMGLNASSPHPTPGVVVAGVAGGALRAASGYGFLRIQRWAEACAAAVARGGAPIGHPPEPFVRREMDRIFLQAILAHPERTADYFMALASGMPADRLVRFLSDQATAGDYARIVASLPLAPFLAQIPRRRHPAPMLEDARI